jgi:hypothetical protein
VIVRFVLWSLADSETTVAELRRSLGDEWADAEVEGVGFKASFSDEATERWGAFYVFESPEAAEQSGPDRAHELIGKDPDIVEEFDLEE